MWSMILRRSESIRLNGPLRTEAEVSGATLRNVSSRRKREFLHETNEGFRNYKRM